MKRVAPNLAADPVKAYYMRPTMADPPMCSIVDLKTVLTIDDLADMHEALNAREAVAYQQREEAKRNRKKGRR